MSFALKAAVAVAFAQAAFGATIPGVSANSVFRREIDPVAPSPAGTDCTCDHGSDPWAWITLYPGAGCTGDAVDACVGMDLSQPMNSGNGITSVAFTGGICNWEGYDAVTAFDLCVSAAVDDIVCQPVVNGTAACVDLGDVITLITTQSVVYA